MILDRITAALTIPPTWAVPLVSIAIGYRTDQTFTQHGTEHDASDDRAIRVRGWAAKIVIGRDDTDSLYQNAAIFVRINLIGIWCMIRWSGKAGIRSFLQTGIGWKLNGVPAVLFRIQSDESAEAGMNGPNWGQGKGWNKGPH